MHNTQNWQKPFGLFISSNNTDNIYEAVYDKNGNIITENNDYGKNMGTYNYASSSKHKKKHNKDEDTDDDGLNDDVDPEPLKKAYLKSFGTKELI